MDKNILKQSDVTNIILTYAECGIRKRYSVKLRFMDTKECYFAVPMPQNFQKPQRKTPVDITVYTPEGVYTTKLVIVDSVVSMNEVLFNVTIPTVWNFKQLRQSSRKSVALPVQIKYNDGYVINAETFDIALGGISFISKSPISSIYQRLNCIISVTMPDNLIINFPDKKLIVEGKFVRSKERSGNYSDEGVLQVYKFLGLSVEQQEILKGYLLKLE